VISDKDNVWLRFARGFIAGGISRLLPGHDMMLHTGMIDGRGHPFFA